MIKLNLTPSILNCLNEGGIIKINSNEIQLVLKETPVKKSDMIYGYEFNIKEGFYVLDKSIKFSPNRLHILRYNTSYLTSEFIVHTSEKSTYNLVMSDLKYAHLCHDRKSGEIILEAGCDDVLEYMNNWHSVELAPCGEKDVMITRFKF